VGVEVMAEELFVVVGEVLAEVDAVGSVAVADAVATGYRRS
jgi:hypothetical protein